MSIRNDEAFRGANPQVSIRGLYCAVHTYLFIRQAEVVGLDFQERCYVDVWLGTEAEAKAQTKAKAEAKAKAEEEAKAEAKAKEWAKN